MMVYLLTNCGQVVYVSNCFETWPIWAQLVSMLCVFQTAWEILMVYCIYNLQYRKRTCVTPSAVAVTVRAIILRKL